MSEWRERRKAEEMRDALAIAVRFKQQQLDAPRPRPFEGAQQHFDAVDDQHPFEDEVRLRVGDRWGWYERWVV
jgi:hypothetical protein